jgi:hypothetical protein
MRTMVADGTSACAPASSSTPAVASSSRAIALAGGPKALSGSCSGVISVIRGGLGRPTPSKAATISASS